MKITTRYVTGNFLTPFLFCAGLFVSMFVIVDCLNHLDNFLASETPLRVIGLYYASMIPVILNQTLPAAIIIASLYSLSQLGRHNEITALKANGLSGLKILFPVFYIGLLVSAGLILMNESVTPFSTVVTSSIKYGLIEKQKTALGQRSIQNVTLLARGNRMIYARELALATKSLYDVIVLEHFDDLHLKSKTTAQRAVYQNGVWVFYDVLEYEVNEEGDILKQPRHAERQVSDIHEKPEVFVNQFTQPEYMSFRQLKAYLEDSRITGFAVSSRLLMELHQKFARPFACLILLLVTAPMAIAARRGGAMISLGVGVAVIMAYYATAAFSAALGKGGALPPIAAAWLPNVIFLAVGTVQMRRNL
ncbi:MAG: LptF/LptG family permease [Candidatus Omnitrophica bacterium]|nr:LptF/LptG family permease [Candidatus Omnitrophota bacterium]